MKGWCPWQWACFLPRLQARTHSVGLLALFSLSKRELLAHAVYGLKAVFTLKFNAGSRADVRCNGRTFCSGRRPGFAPAGEALFFVSPKKSAPKKGDPTACVPSLRCGQPAVPASSGVLLKLALCKRSNSHKPLSAGRSAPRRRQTGGENPDSRTAGQPDSRTAGQPNSQTAKQPVTDCARTAPVNQCDRGTGFAGPPVASPWGEGAQRRRGEPISTSRAFGNTTLARARWPASAPAHRGSPRSSPVRACT